MTRFEQIAENAIREAELVPGSMEAFLEGLKTISVACLERIALEG